MVLHRGKPLRQLHDRIRAHGPEGAEEEIKAIASLGPGQALDQPKKTPRERGFFCPATKQVQAASRRRSIL
jgi:hypothetical protein